jgi:hypothetical protein
MPQLLLLNFSRLRVHLRLNQEFINASVFINIKVFIEGLDRNMRHSDMKAICQPPSVGFNTFGSFMAYYRRKTRQLSDGKVNLTQITGTEGCPTKTRTLVDISLDMNNEQNCLENFTI